MSFLLSRLGTVAFANTIYPEVLTSVYFLSAGEYDWTAPSTMVPGSLTALVIGGGGGAQYYDIAGSYSGGGGAMVLAPISASPGSTFTVIVGSGGAGGMPTYNPSWDGGSSSILGGYIPKLGTRRYVHASAGGGKSGTRSSGSGAGGTAVSALLPYQSRTGTNGITGLNVYKNGDPGTQIYITDDGAAPWELTTPFGQLPDNGNFPGAFPASIVSFKLRFGGTQQWPGRDRYLNYPYSRAFPFWPGYGGCTFEIGQSNPVYTIGDWCTGRRGFIALAFRYVPKPRPYIFKKEFAITANLNDYQSIDLGAIPFSNELITSFELSEYSYDPNIIKIPYYVNYQANGGHINKCGTISIGKNIPVGVYAFTVNITTGNGEIVEYHVTVRAV